MLVGLGRLVVALVMCAALCAATKSPRPPPGSVKLVCERVSASMFDGLTAIALQNSTVIGQKTRLRNILQAALVRRSEIQGKRKRPSRVNPAYLVSNWLQPLPDSNNSTLCGYKSDAIDSILTCARFVSENTSESDILDATIKGATQLLEQEDEEYMEGRYSEAAVDDSPAGRSWRCSWNLLRQLEVRVFSCNAGYSPGVIYLNNGIVYQYTRTQPPNGYSNQGRKLEELLLTALLLANQNQAAPVG